MVDAIIVTTLAASGIALATAILTHIRYSNCWGMSCRTRSKDSPSITPTSTTPLIPPPINFRAEELHF